MNWRFGSQGRETRCCSSKKHDPRGDEMRGHFEPPADQPQAADGASLDLVCSRMRLASAGIGSCCKGVPSTPPKTCKKPRPPAKPSGLRCSSQLAPRPSHQQLPLRLLGARRVSLARGHGLKDGRAKREGCLLSRHQACPPPDRKGPIAITVSMVHRPAAMKHLPLRAT